MPTFDFTDEDTKAEWTNTLSACSFKWMQIIIDVKQNELNRVQSEMSLVQKELMEQQGLPGYSDLDTQHSKRSDKLERGAISTKKEKRSRDQLDYDTHKVYIW